MFKMVIRVLLSIMLMVCLFLLIGFYASRWLQTIHVDASVGFCTWTMLALVFSYVFGRIKYVPAVMSNALNYIGAIAIVIFEWSVLLIIAGNLIGIVAVYGFGFETNEVVRVLGFVSIGLLIAGIVIGSYYAWKPIVRKYHFEIMKSALGEQKSFRILIASDLHAGRIVGRNHLQRLVNIVQREQPDLILLAGDVLDDDVRPFLDQGMDELLGQMRAPLGVFAILGNHEYYGRGIKPYVQAMQNVGIRVMQDEVEVLPGFGIVAGRKDVTANSMMRGDGAGRMTVEELLQSADKTKPIIVLDHQPRGYSLAEAAGADLIISGHTHRGQIWPNHFFTKRLFDLDWGYAKFGKMHAIVSSGFGTWGPPVRLNSQSEVVIASVMITG